MNSIDNTPKKSFDPHNIEHGYGNRFLGFQNLMRFRIRNILLVSSLYDLYLFEEDGRLYELIRAEYQLMNLSHSPDLVRVSNGKDAIEMVKEEKRFDLIITTLHIDDMTAINFANLVRESGLDVPVILLAHDNRELKYLMLKEESKVFEQIFIWQGDFRIIIAIIKFIEDRINAEHDTRIVGVQSIIVIEDSVRYYSSFLPIIYSELLNQSTRLISEGVNLTHKFLRMRARPKIILCNNYEDAWEYFEQNQEYILGIISDVDFPHYDVQDKTAGIKFAKAVKEVHQDIPVLLMSQDETNEELAYEADASFLQKHSTTLLDELRHFMIEFFSFGDFVFRTPDGDEVGRAADLKSLKRHLKSAPIESIKYHAERNHFSNWLKARTEFWLAHQLRPRRVTDYSVLEDLRFDLIDSLCEYQEMRQRGIITDFKKETFDPVSGFARIGGGSLGGKARGLGFVNTLINDYHLRNKFEHVLIHVPAAVVIGTDVFDQFMEENKLHKFALKCEDDDEITRRFLAAPRFPEEIIMELAEFLDIIRTPVAIRSSSLLEDSQYHPFAGVYDTYMLPNNEKDSILRLENLIITIKKVYASTFHKRAKDYINVTNYRLEEEKMAVVIQKIIGKQHESRFYPDFSGVGKSYNFYPHPPQTSVDGIVDVALGLGKEVVDGGNTVRFCPKYPTDLIQFYSVEESLDNNQTEFYALNLDGNISYDNDPEDSFVEHHKTSVAEHDGSLFHVGSTYVAENDAIYDGLSRNGLRVVTFSPILKYKLFPLPEILSLLLEMGAWGMGTPVEIEFAVNMSVKPRQPREFGFLQMRPLVVSDELDELDFEDFPRENAFCHSDFVLGHGLIEDIKDVVYVDFDKFDRGKTQQIAEEVAYYNGKLVQDEKPYILIGYGRWGTLDPWLGIPVKWEQIAGAKAIIEANLKEFSVKPSQGSHFFQNITSFMIGYFTVNQHIDQGFVDWDWIKKQKPVSSKEYTNHISFDKPFSVKLNGHQHVGIIYKPEE